MLILLFTLAITLGTLATYAQGNDLTVRNASSSAITVATVSVVNGTGINPCGIAATDMPGTVIQPNASATITTLTGNNNNEWYEIRVQSVPSGLGLGPVGSARSYNKCLLQCSPPADYSNGLTAIWNTSCNDEVTVF